MQRAFGLLVLLSIGGLTVAALMAAGVIPQHAGTAHLGIGRLTIEPASFVVGFAAAIGLGWLRRLPWSRLLEVLGAILRIWRRNVAMLLLCAVFAGILLFY